jgi:hypothetical protein
MLILACLFKSYDYEQNLYNAGRLYMYLITSLDVGLKLSVMTIALNLSFTCYKRQRKLQASFLNMFTAYFCIYGFAIWLTSFLIGIGSVEIYWKLASACGFFGITVLLDSLIKKNAPNTH